MLRPGNLATPPTAATPVAPESVPLPGFAPRATATVAVKVGSVLPSPSCAVTSTGGVIAEPAAAPDGCTVNARCVAAPATTVKAVLVAGARPVASALSV